MCLQAADVCIVICVYTVLQASASLDGALKTPSLPATTLSTKPDIHFIEVSKARVSGNASFPAIHCIIVWIRV